MAEKLSKNGKSIGRPRIYPVGERRPTLSFRIRYGLYGKLKAYAEANDFSTSEAIEALLRERFEMADLRTIIREELIGVSLKPAPQLIALADGTVAHRNELKSALRQFHREDKVYG